MSLTLTYKKYWNAASNTPFLSDATGTTGFVYTVMVGGSQNLGSGIISPSSGQILLYNGVQWIVVPDTITLSSYGTFPPPSGGGGGGMTNPMTTLGDMIYGFTAGAPVRLPIGTTNQILTVVAGIPTWTTPSSSGGTVTSIATTSPILGGTITTTGTISIQQASGSQGGYLSSTDWNTFNGKQAVLSGSGIVTSALGTISYIAGTSSQFVKGDGSLDSTSYGTGTVTSIGLSTDASWMTVGSSPVTSSGTITFNKTTGLTANQFLATPNGSTGTVGLRSIVAADVPTLNQNTTGNAATVTTNANLTGPITSSGNATSIASQTGTGTTFVMAAAPTLTSVSTSTGAVASIDGTQTLSNKRDKPRVGTSTSNSATPTIDTDNYDAYLITAQSTNITSFTTNLTGTPNSCDTLVIGITDSGSPVTISWGSSFESSTVTLPTTTVANKLLLTQLFWNSVTSKWRCVGVA